MVIGKISPFNPDKDDFEAWVEVVNNYFVANDVDNAKAVAVLISSMGLPTYTLLKSLVAPNEPAKQKYDDIILVLMKHFKPAPKALSERHKFYLRKQHEGESVNVFLSELRRLAVTCKFGDLSTSLRDQFIFGLTSETSQKRIFLENDSVALDKVVAIAISQEQAESSTQIVRNGSTSVLEATNQVSRKYGKKGQKSKSSSPSQSQNKSHCPNCGASHSRRDCPHRDVECFKCHKKGHFSKMCRSVSSDKQVGQRNAKQVQKLSVKSVSNPTQEIIVNVKIGGVAHQMEFDTASGSTFLDSKFWRQMGSPRMQPSNIQFLTFTKQLFKSKGRIHAELEHNGQKKKVALEINDGTSLFGRDLINKFQMDWNSILSQCNQL
jgi:hypothetical protein